MILTMNKFIFEEYMNLDPSFIRQEGKQLKQIVSRFPSTEESKFQTKLKLGAKEQQEKIKKREHFTDGMKKITRIKLR